MNFYTRTVNSNEIIVFSFLSILLLSILITFPESEKLINYIIIITLLIQILNLILLLLFSKSKTSFDEVSNDSVNFIQVFGLWIIFLNLFFLKSNIFSQIASLFRYCINYPVLLVVIAFLVLNLTAFLLISKIMIKMNFQHKIRIQYIIVYLLFISTEIL